MATLQETIAAAKAEILAQAARIVRTQAQAQLALVVLRIQSQGIGVRYSSKGVPVFFFYNKALNAKGREYVRLKQKQKDKKARLGTWEEFRQYQGLPGGFVNLTYTGRSIRSLTTTDGGNSGLVFTARIVSADQESARIIRCNLDRYGDFLAPNATEAAEIAQVAQVELSRIIQRFFPV